MNRAVTSILYIFLVIAPCASRLSISDIPIRDPQILLYNEMYYLTGTTAVDGFLLYSSDDLVTWNNKSYMMQDYPQWIDHNYWASELNRVGSFFKLVFTGTMENGTRGIGIASTPSLDLSFIDYNEKPITSSDQSCIDGHVFEDVDGKLYLFYAIEGFPWKIVVQELDPSFSKLVGPQKTIIECGDAWSATLVEAPYMIKYDGTYWLFWSSYTIKGYAIGCSRANSVMGTYTHRDVPVYDEDGGHCSLFYKKGASTPSIIFHQPSTFDVNIDAERAVIKDLKFDGANVIVIDPGFGISWVTTCMCLLLGLVSIITIFTLIRVHKIKHAKSTRRSRVCY